MRKIAVITGTRAEYGLLKNTLKKIEKSEKLELQLIVTGTHLSKKHGYTIEEIKNDGIEIAATIPIINEENTNSISSEITKAIEGFTKEFNILKPDIVLILGDRYEIFAVATVAMIMNIPIAHISGGEVTEGAIDEQIRHAITKMAHIHFPGAKEYVQNIVNMGEEPWRVFEVGDPAIENIKKTSFLSCEELFEELGVKVDKDTLLVTYHPVTLETHFLKDHIKNLLNALSKINKKLIITYPNSDNGGDYIIQELIKFHKQNSNVYLFKSLGIRRYLSVMKLCGAVVGNSSSALIEAPYLKVPVVNIGNRQKGRLMADNIVCCNDDENEIIQAIEKAYDPKFIRIVNDTKSLYGEGNTSDEIVNVLESIEINDKLLKKKLVWS